MKLLSLFIWAPSILIDWGTSCTFYSGVCCNRRATSWFPSGVSISLRCDSVWYPVLWLSLSISFVSGVCSTRDCFDSFSLIGVGVIKWTLEGYSWLFKWFFWLFFIVIDTVLEWPFLTDIGVFFKGNLITFLAFGLLSLFWGEEFDLYWADLGLFHRSKQLLRICSNFLA